LADGTIHGYTDATILRIHLLQNKGEEVELYKLVKGWTVTYVPCLADEVTD
jgi:hypothetical protein